MGPVLMGPALMGSVGFMGFSPIDRCTSSRHGLFLGGQGKLRMFWNGGKGGNRLTSSGWPIENSLGPASSVRAPGCGQSGLEVQLPSCTVLVYSARKPHKLQENVRGPCFAPSEGLRSSQQAGFGFRISQRRADSALVPVCFANRDFRRKGLVMLSGVGQLNCEWTGEESFSLPKLWMNQGEQAAMFGWPFALSVSGDYR